MILCLACYDDRLAALFENAADLRLYESKDGEIIPAGRLSMAQADLGQRITALSAHGVNMLLCGGICRTSAGRLEQAGIRVISWLCGDEEQVLQAFRAENFNHLAMPGCIGRRAGQGPCRGRRENSGRGCGRKGFGQNKQ